MQRQASGRPVVLIVEDEALLRWQAAEIVEDAGFDVVEAATADEAITVLETRNDIRLVFTDIQMPGSIDGLRLAHLVKNRWPPVQIIATSGRLKLRDDDLPRGWTLLVQALRCHRANPSAQRTGPNVSALRGTIRPGIRNAV